MFQRSRLPTVTGRQMDLHRLAAAGSEAWKAGLWVSDKILRLVNRRQQNPLRVEAHSSSEVVIAVDRPKAQATEKAEGLVERTTNPTTPAAI